jgi:hypothetical protein
LLPLLCLSVQPGSKQLLPDISHLSNLLFKLRTQQTSLLHIHSFWKNTIITVYSPQLRKLELYTNLAKTLVAFLPRFNQHLLPVRLYRLGHTMLPHFLEGIYKWYKSDTSEFTEWLYDNGSRCGWKPCQGRSRRLKGDDRI